MVAGTGTPSHFLVDDAVVLPPLHELAGVAKVSQPREGRRTEVRYDTADRALRRRAFTLSRFTDNDGGTRWERRAPSLEPAARAGTPADPGAGVPPELLEEVQAVVRGRELLPVQTLSTRFLEYELLDSAGTVLARVTDESTRTSDAGGDPSGRDRRAWGIDSAGDALARDAGAMFLAAGAVPAGPAPGGERNATPAGPAGDAAAADSDIGDRDGAAVGPLETGSPVALLLLRYLREQFEELLRHDPRVRRGDADGIHKMRVATRRLRSALASYRSTMDPEPARSLRGELRWLARVLGEARDAQVMRHRLQELIAAEPDDLVMGPVAARVDEELLHDYRQAFGNIREVLQSPRYFQALDGLEGLLASPFWAETAKEPAGPAAARIIRRDRKRLHRRVRAARTLDGEDYAEALHDARKDAKQLRYAAEVWAPVQPKEAKEMVDAAEHVQKILGEHQDSVVTQAYLRRMGATASAAGENGFTYGRLHALEQAHAKSARERFVHAWKGFPSSP
ncbi:CYTH and CHAD domain-containing protein [Arthrobacter sp. zg-Y769]|uniref:CYTH and CHAD domain-containing protein n=1 Tax=Arthrobacter sp. zg-Y769 TaxID=2894191 RepID=UPI001E499941|nr:CHAD domain-containing protein [Arthrobacter sp. zg-Y769]MCC9206344.1 CHAD domain-containing protein [Arthrobacter sp. zg-Y769]